MNIFWWNRVEQWVGNDIKRKWKWSAGIVSAQRRHKHSHSYTHANKRMNERTQTHIQSIYAPSVWAINGIEQRNPFSPNEFCSKRSVCVCVRARANCKRSLKMIFGILVEQRACEKDSRIIKCNQHYGKTSTNQEFRIHACICGEISVRSSLV